MLKRIVDGMLASIVAALCLLLGYGAATYASCNTLECDIIICRGTWTNQPNCVEYSEGQGIRIYSPGPYGGTLTATQLTVNKMPNCSQGCTLGCGSGKQWSLIWQEAVCGMGCGDPVQLTKNICKNGSS